MTRRALFAMAAAVVVASVSACSRGGQPPVSADAAADSADQIMFDVSTNMTDAGVLRGIMYADTTYIFDQNSRFEFRGVRAEFMKASGEQDGTLTARRGRYDLRNSVLEGYGNVKIVTKDGRQLTSEHLRYDQGRNLVSSDSAFVLVQGDRRQTGIGFEADPQLTRFQCKGNCGGSAPVSIPVE